MIGVAISTRNRRETAENTVKHWRKHLPKGAKLVVIDDASDDPYPKTWHVTVIRHDYQRGVAMTKNRGIAELLEAGCDHIFLADDDCHPITDDWWQPYTNSPERHLSFQWANGGQRRKILHDDGTHFSVDFPRGVMLYFDATIFADAGGFDIAYGKHGGEHVEYQHRLHELGLTTWAFADVCGSDQLWYSLDKEQGGTPGSSVPLDERKKLIGANAKLWGKEHTNLPVGEGGAVQDWQLGPYVKPVHHYALLEHVATVNPSGVAVEFGVGSGQSTKVLAAHSPVVAFDSGLGLPEDWRPEFPKGTFAFGIPNIPNTRIVEGWFDDTLPNFDFGSLGHIGIVHFDADLYSSTKTALTHIGPHLQPGTFLVFDEFHSYEGCEQHERRAFEEYANETGIGWTVVAHSHEAWAVRIL
ncbi:hypothetical protein KFZ73_14315 [Tsukamurella paurometabola]|uniref:Glycosyl transferase family 2 n=1 Tax=Tsukamurella paurometabola TaxID=2061 RepID=A0ABS5NEN7_TSUPA|nr:hypothetical protein [Tsukamurella paurometabola]